MLSIWSVAMSNVTTCLHTWRFHLPRSTTIKQLYVPVVVFVRKLVQKGLGDLLRGVLYLEVQEGIVECNVMTLSHTRLPVISLLLSESY